MQIYPNGYFNRVSQISLEYLEENKIKGIILDVDNTLIDYYRNMSEETTKWVKNLKENGQELIIVSNSEKEEKIKAVANKLEIDYIYFAMKPLKRGFKKAQKRLKIENRNIAVIGDQIFTDIIGANRMKMFSILVDPIKEKDIWITKLKRPIESYIKKRYLKTKERKN